MMIKSQNKPNLLILNVGNTDDNCRLPDGSLDDICDRYKGESVMAAYINCDANDLKITPECAAALFDAQPKDKPLWTKPEEIVRWDKLNFKDNKSEPRDYLAVEFVQQVLREHKVEGFVSFHTNAGQWAYEFDGAGGMETFDNEALREKHKARELARYKEYTPADLLEAGYAIHPRLSAMPQIAELFDTPPSPRWDYSRLTENGARRVEGSPIGGFRSAEAAIAAVREIMANPSEEIKKPPHVRRGREDHPTIAKYPDGGKGAS